MALSIPATAYPTDNTSYTGVAKAFHWLVVAMLVMQYLIALVLGLILPASAEGTLAQWHFAVGSSIGVVMVLRLAWRLTHTPPPAPADLSIGLQMLSRVTHYAFYLILIVLPVLGWAAASADGAQVKLAGLIPLPMLGAKGNAFGTAMGTVHPTIALTVLGIIAVHVAGAMYHLVVKRDGVVGRILPGRP